MVEGLEPDPGVLEYEPNDREAAAWLEPGNSWCRGSCKTKADTNGIEWLNGMSVTSNTAANNTTFVLVRVFAILVG